KEIGIRKALGGSVWDMIRLFTGEFARLVLRANLVAWPVAYFLMRRWLATFAYRIDMGLWVYVGSGLLALIVALLTVSAVVLRTACAKPIESLRHE
ncbi:MAG TPA: FtsX-like permease family protein, partial [Gammaproteobacteria bacterium]|nr:FtsX-like permease family protein [Gammaproteobacteria bacterium]